MHVSAGRTDVYVYVDVYVDVCARTRANDRTPPPLHPSRCPRSPGDRVDDLGHHAPHGVERPPHIEYIDIPGWQGRVVVKLEGNT